jgi:hypothetical protein
MKRAIAVLAVLLVLLGTMLSNPTWAEARWHGGYHGGRVGWWWPGAVIGGLVLGAVAVVTAPFVALSAPRAYSPPPVYAPPVAYAPPLTYQPAPLYAPPQSTAIQREVVYPNGRYVLYGDGVRQPWQWVWVPLASPPPPPPPPR